MQKNRKVVKSLATGDKYKFGTFLVNGQKRQIPTKPWLDMSFHQEVGNIIDCGESNDIVFSFGDSDNDSSYNLNWVEVRSDNKIYYICDRVIARNFGSSVLANSNLSTPFAEIGSENVIVIDGKRFTPFLFDAATDAEKWTFVPYPTIDTSSFDYDGTAQSPTWTGYDPEVMDMLGSTEATNAGRYITTFQLKDKSRYAWDDGTRPLGNNFWERTVCNGDNFEGLPSPTSTDFNNTLDSADSESVNNLFWNWVGAGTISSDTIRGYSGVNATTQYDMLGGYRPCLMALDEIEEDYWTQIKEERVATPYHLNALWRLDIDPLKQRVDQIGSGLEDLLSTYGKGHIIYDESQDYTVGSEEQPMRQRELLQFLLAASWNDEEKHTTFVDAEGVLEAIANEIGYIDIPVINDLNYTGEEQNIDLDVNSQLIKVKGTTSATEIGSYEIILSLKYKSHFRWSDGTVEDKHLFWNIVEDIEKVQVSIPKIKNRKYNGQRQSPIISSIADFVIDEGQKVEGDVRFTIQWNDTDVLSNNDLDAKCIEPDGTTIYWANKKSTTTGGVLNIDTTAPVDEGIVGVENITWANRNTMTPGLYKFYVKCYNYRNVDDGFRAEFEIDGNIYAFNYTEPWTSSGQEVFVGECRVNSNHSLNFEPAIRTVNDGSENGYNYSYDVDLVDVSGSVWETNSGTYTIIFSLKDPTHYEWSDGTVEDKVMQWTITTPQKQNPTLTVSNNNISLTKDNNRSIISFSTNSNGTATVISNNSAITAMVVDNSMVIITGSGNGTITGATVTVSVGETNTYNSISRQITVNYDGATYVNGVKIVSWSDGSDTDVAAMVKGANEGKIDLKDYWNLGDERQVNLSAMSASSIGYDAQPAQTVTFVLMQEGYAHLVNPVLDKNGNTRKACSYVVGMKHCLQNTGKINSTNTNVGSWNDSERRTWCNTIFRNAIPSTLRPIFSQFWTCTAKTPSGSINQDSNDYFTLPAEKEIFGTGTYSNQTEANKLVHLWYYASGPGANNKKKTVGGNNAVPSSGIGDPYWLRSPSTGFQNSFCVVTRNGIANDASPNYSYGLSPFGCI